MKSVCLVVTNDLTYDQRMQRICVSLSNSGRVTKLIGRRLNTSKELKKSAFKQHRFNCIFNRGKLFYIEFNLRLFFYLLSERSNIFCAVDLDTMSAVYLAGRIKKKKLVYDAHELFTEVPELADRIVTRKIWLCLERALLPRFDAHYTVSGSIKKHFEKAYNRSFQVIRNLPLKEDSMSAQNNADSKYFLYQGALNEGRGVVELIHAWQQVTSHELWLAGEGDLSDYLRKEVKKLRLEGCVKFLGRVEPNQLKKITASAFAGFNLLENRGLSYYYSLANKFFDYMQAGIPSINMQFPEYQAINAQYEVSVLIDELSVDKIRTAVDNLTGDLNFYRKLSTNAQRANDLYTWQCEEQKLLEIYTRFD